MSGEWQTAEDCWQKKRPWRTQLQYQLIQKNTVKAKALFKKTWKEMRWKTNVLYWNLSNQSEWSWQAVIWSIQGPSEVIHCSSLFEELWSSKTPENCRRKCHFKIRENKKEIIINKKYFLTNWKKYICTNGQFQHFGANFKLYQNPDVCLFVCLFIFVRCTDSQKTKNSQLQIHENKDVCVCTC